MIWSESRVQSLDEQGCSTLRVVFNHGLLLIQSTRNGGRMYLVIQYHESTKHAHTGLSKCMFVPSALPPPTNHRNTASGVSANGLSRTRVDAPTAN